MDRMYSIGERVLGLGRLELAVGWGGWSADNDYKVEERLGPVVEGLDWIGCGERNKTNRDGNYVM